ncbi:TonB-dependent receptor [Roseomonas aerophila]|uniref:TonB-dependent receptor n=2 Tax=Teichococcus aerophilus TaxID=1224513 RepID=A0ABR7RSG3_9PROT|nr:TonB-dependent receptor [Pseudoroseomonas aerophila]
MAANTAPVQLPEVNVQASALASGLLPPRAGGQVATGGGLGLLGNPDAMDTPFNTLNVTSQRIEDSQARTVQDALSFDPSIRGTGQQGGIFDAFYIRGFPIGEGNAGEIAFDGRYGIAPNYRVFSEYVERIEVLKGPGALLYGMAPNGAVGGVINIVPKRADEDLTRLTTDYSSDSQLGAHLDFARRYGENREFGLRFNGSYRDGDTAVDEQSRRAGVTALALDYQGERLRVWMDALWQRERFDAPSRPLLLAAGVPIPRAPGGQRNITQSWEWSRMEDTSGLLRAEYDLTDSITAFAAIGGSESEVDRLFGTPTITSFGGDTLHTPQHFRFEAHRYTYDAGLRARFETGPVRHTVSLQASRYHEALDRATVNGTPVASNIYTRVNRPAQDVAAPGRVPRVSETELTGLAIADTLSVLDDRVMLTLGLRNQQVETDNFNAANGQVSSRYDKSAVTPMVGLVVRPWQNVALYANYIQGLSRGDMAPATASNAGEVFAPYETEQYEIGVKLELGQLSTTVSAFQISKPSAELAGSRYVVSGEQRVRGLEWNVFGEITPGLRALGGATVMDPELTSSANRAVVGNRPVGVPTVQANAALEWDLPWVSGLTAGGALTYTGSQWLDTTNDRQFPAWTRADLNMRYRTEIAGRATTFRANVYNVADSKYWSSVSSYGTFSQGAPRTYLLSMTVDF